MLNCNINFIWGTEAAVSDDKDRGLDCLTNEAYGGYPLHGGGTTWTYDLPWWQ